MKIVGGFYRSRSLKTLKNDSGIRPTLGRIRESVFDLIAGYVEGSDFLDLFAGTGAVGMEAVSRGAKKTVFVEKNPRYARLIKENITLLKISELHEVEAEVALSDAYHYIESPGEDKTFDIVFADPPYKTENYEKIVENIVKNGIIRKDGVVVCEHSGKFFLEVDCVPLYKRRKYGDTMITIFRNR